MTAVALALAVVRSASAQTTITGKVVDAANQEPVPAVTVTVTGTTIGALTTDSGRFTLRRVPSDAKSISVRRIGYRGVTVAIVPNQTDYTVAVTRDVLQLEQQVITGVATTISSKTSATANTIVTGDQLNAAPTPTIENALQGKIPGAVIEQNSGAPGGGLQVNIRGVTSINGNSDPLYVVDGVIVTNYTFASGLNALSAAGSNNGGVNPGNQDQSVNRIADLNPADIADIQVLSGAAASSIYGNRAAGGVVVITTKKGQVGAPQVDFTQRVGTFNLEHELDVLHYTKTAAETMGEGFGMTKAQVDANYATCNGFCDFQKSLYGGGQLSYETDLAVRGGLGGSGANTTTYYVSGLTKYDNGAQINTGYHKQSARANFSQGLFNTITVGANLAYTSSLTSRGINGNDNLGIAGYDVLSYTPSWFCMNCHSSNGQYVFNPFGPANAYQDATEASTPEEVNRTTLGGNVDWHLWSAQHQTLQFVANGGADFANQRDQFYLPPGAQVSQSHLVSLPGTSTYQSGYARYSNFNVSMIHTWKPSDVLNATTSLGVTRDKTATYQVNNVGQNLVTGLPNFQFAPVQAQFNQQQEANDEGYYGQEQLLLFSERLSLTGGVNAERASSNGAINKYYLYPKIAGAFRPIMGKTELKLRGAYGQAGNLPPYGYKFTEATLNTDNGVSGIGFSEISGDGKIRPETNTTEEGGFDLSVFNSRAAFGATVYQKRITNLVLLENVLPSSGFNTAYSNGGQLTNQGLEMYLQATPIQAGQFSWSSSETYARNYARIDQLPIPPFAAGAFFGYSPFGGYRIQTGADPNAVWGYTKSSNGNLVQIGNAAPAFVFTFIQDLNYGPAHVHVGFDWREGQTVANLTQQYFDFNGQSGDTAAAHQRITNTFAGLSPYAMHASFLKLRELTFKYDLPGIMIKTLGQGYLRNASISLSGRNLVTWTKYPGLDPEVSNFGNQQLGRGQDVTPYPPTRSYFLSIDLGL
jgi:TonB-dependent SusC/RagA subfamily outer membrane receptor